MKKNIIKPLLAIVCLLSSITLYAHDFEVDGICYNITSETGQTVEVTFRGDNYESYTNKYTGTVVIPESVTYNGINYSVSSIGDRAFIGCPGLTEVTIPNSVTSIGVSAFEGCENLTKVIIPNSVTSIGEEAFVGCLKLTEVTIPNSVTSIGESAFFYCTGLTEVTIGNSVTSIGERAFSGCTRLTSIVIEEGNRIYDSRENCNAIIETASNTLITGCKNTVIPNSVTSIGEYAFEDCENLTIVTIPNSVLSIGNYAFAGCEKLAVMKVKAKNPPAIKEHTFKGVDKSMHLYVPAGMIGKYQSMSYWSDFINILEEEPMDVQLTLQNSIYNNVVFYLPYGTMQKLEIKTLDDSYVLNSVVFNGKDVTDEIINDVYVTPELTDDAVLNISYDTSSVENLFLNNNRIKAYGHNGNIVVTGCEYGESIAIYDVDGILLRSLLANSDMMRISMPSESIYMVKVADSAIKVAL